MDTAAFMESSELVWFRPIPEFFRFFGQSEWKWRRYHDCGAGVGYLTSCMQKAKLECVAYDLHPREKSLVKVEQFNTANIADRMDFSEVALIARPCHHPEFIDVTIRSALEMGEVFYIGLTKNFERDLEQFEYEIPAMGVGQGGEDLVRIRCAKDKACVRRQILNPASNQPEWWWYKNGRYRTEPTGLSGFNASGNETVLQERRWTGDLQTLTTKAEACTEDSPHGWIAPDGEWFGCGYAQHDYIARDVLGCSVRRLEDLGFIRCHGEDSGSSWSIGDRSNGQPRRPTPKQKRTLKAHGFNPDR